MKKRAVVSILDMASVETNGEQTVDVEKLADVMDDLGYDSTEIRKFIETVRNRRSEIMAIKREREVGMA